MTALKHNISLDEYHTLFEYDPAGQVIWKTGRNIGKRVGWTMKNGNTSYRRITLIREFGVVHIY